MNTTLSLLSFLATTSAGQAIVADGGAALTAIIDALTHIHKAEASTKTP